MSVGRMPSSPAAVSAATTSVNGTVGVRAGGSSDTSDGRISEHRGPRRPASAANVDVRVERLIAA